MGKVDNGKGQAAEKWFSHQLTAEEFRNFVDEAQNSQDNSQIRQAFIGVVAPDAAERVKAVSGKTVSKIMIDNGQIRHDYKKASHNLEPDDVFHIIDVINTATNITLSEKEFLESPALIFEKDLGGNVTFLVQVRSAFGGWLAFADCWRQKKKRG